MLKWRSIGGNHPDLRGEPVQRAAVGGRRLPDTLVFDFAPSYNCTERFQFDAELLAIQRATRFAPEIRSRAEAAASRLFGSTPFLAAHLRRDGYEHYCSSATSGLAHYSRRRFGVHVSAEACFPSVEQVAATLRASLVRHGLQRVLLATNSINATELAQLQALVPFQRWEPGLLGAHTRMGPLIELLPGKRRRVRGHAAVDLVRDGARAARPAGLGGTRRPSSVA